MKVKELTPEDLKANGLCEEMRILFNTITDQSKLIWQCQGEMLIYPKNSHYYQESKEELYKLQQDLLVDMDKYESIRTELINLMKKPTTIFNTPGNGRETFSQLPAKSFVRNFIATIGGQ